MGKRVLCLSIALVIAAGAWPIGGRWGAIRAWVSPSVLAGRSQSVPVEQVLIRGNRRISEQTIKVWIGTREGDPYSPEQINRDIKSLSAQGYFDQVKAYAEDGTRGGKIVTFEVKEWPLILDIRYDGLKTLQQSKILEEFRKRTIGLSKESQYDPVKAHRAAAVIKEMLADEGHPDAKVDVEREDISQTAVALIFKIDEGPRVRVADIEFQGNKVYSSSYLRGQMKYVKEVGLLTTFTQKDIYHKEKLKVDLDRLRALVYAENGYLQAHFGEPRVEDAGKVGTWVPLFGHKGQGLKIVIPINEGRQYRVGDVKVEGNTELTGDQIKQVLGLKTGEIFKGYTVFQKQMENLKKLYGSRGYIQFSAVPEPEFKDSTGDTTTGIADMTINVEEGKQFTLRRLEFIGNTFTRDNVLRREVLINEGERYNKQYWDMSILRLNQLGYFEQIKDEDATVNTNDREGTADITLKVQEKGRQQISFTGGVSGIGGSYIGIDYSTNNLLGYGESLSFSLAGGNRQRIFSVGFTEPYIKGRPISLGVNLFYQNLQFVGQGIRNLTTGAYNVSSSNPFSQGYALFNEKTTGGSISLSAPLQYFAPKFRMGHFIRLGLSYSYRTTDIQDPKESTDVTSVYGEFIPQFRQKGVTQSTLTTTISYNTLNSSLDPTMGQSMTLGASLSGGWLGGKVNTISPYVEYKYFRPLFAGKEAAARIAEGKSRTLGFRVFFGHLSTFGSTFDSNSLSFVGGVPLYSRFYLGGEESIRGYNIRSISPLIPLDQTYTTRNIYATNGVEDATARRMKVRNPDKATGNSIAPDVLSKYLVTNQKIQTATGYQQYYPLGGDTQALFNLEYRIPIVGPVQLVPFLDIGSVWNMSSYKDQRISGEFVPQAQNQYYDYTYGVPLLIHQPITLNPRGEIATRREIKRAKTPESGGALPPGFKTVYLWGEQQDVTNIYLSQKGGGIFDNYRYSMGSEVRVQVPVLNVPFRLIFAWNPNARVLDPSDPMSYYIYEERRVVRFSVGRTF